MEGNVTIESIGAIGLNGAIEANGAIGLIGSIGAIIRTSYFPGTKGSSACHQ